MNTNFKAFANSFQAIARLRLESIECLLHHLSNPQNALKFIHVAGTNGKGSVCSFLQCIFTAAGFKTGKYTSPNLISVRERISIDGAMISQDELDSIMSAIENAVKLTSEELGESPTQFEIWTAAAFCYFKQKNCDIVILETGLGGTRDATNIIPPPLASVITEISLDHTEYLGDTISEIASQKAGIIKKHTDSSCGITVSARQPEAAVDVLKRTCAKEENTLIFVNTPVSNGFSDFHEIFDYTSSDGQTIKNLCCGITGCYQPENAALAIETAIQLGLDVIHIKNGIKTAKNPARFEIIRRTPTVIYDGAHNSNGMHALASCLRRYFPEWMGAVFITAFMADKDISGIFDELKKAGLDTSSDFFAVQVNDNPRAATPSEICKVASKCGISVRPFSSLHDAYAEAIKKNKLVILCGSLYLYKDFSEIETTLIK